MQKNHSTILNYKFIKIRKIGQMKSPENLFHYIYSLSKVSVFKLVNFMTVFKKKICILSK